MRQLIKIAATSLLPVGFVYGALLICRWNFDLFYYIVLPSLPISLGAAYVTSLACRFADRRGWRLNWHFGLFGTVVAGVLAGFFIGLANSLQSGGWGKLDPSFFFLWICASGSVFGLLPAVLVARHYRKRLRDPAHAGLTSAP
jgi:hypothetical protein